MMKLSFEGTEDDCKNWIANQGIYGTWVDEPNKVKMLRCKGGAQVHWSSTKMTMWVSGKPDAKSRMETRLEIALQNVDDDEDFDIVD